MLSNHETLPEPGPNGSKTVQHHLESMLDEAHDAWSERAVAEVLAGFDVLLLPKTGLAGPLDELDEDDDAAAASSGLGFIP